MNLIIFGEIGYIWYRSITYICISKRNLFRAASPKSYQTSFLN